MSSRPTSLAILLPVMNEGINLRIMLKILRATVEVPLRSKLTMDPLIRSR